MAHTITDRTTKGFKKEAMRAADGNQPLSPIVQSWLNENRAPPQAPTPTPPHPSQPSFYERKRAQLVLRKARVDALIHLRACALKSRHWPRLREAREADKENEVRLMRVKAREERAKAEAARERAAADARVAHLMALRSASRQNRVML
ncbi:hypothetical protein B0H11DRAFT_2234355 [Mycena galericulata]|nr:hypothetical protein B0H11DRAFT_2234355 [Mycena galericulata]